MGPNEENGLRNGDIQAHRNVDWTRYGLRDAETQRNIEKDKDNNGSEMYQTGANELFAQEYVSTCKAMFNLLRSEY